VILYFSLSSKLIFTAYPHQPNLAGIPLYQTKNLLLVLLLPVNKIFWAKDKVNWDNNFRFGIITSFKENNLTN